MTFFYNGFKYLHSHIASWYIIALIGEKEMGMNNIYLRKTTVVILIFFMIVMTLESLLIPSVSSTSLTYYVSTTGNDTNGDGSFNNPWRTIQKAANLVSTGDTVYVRGGTYYEEVVIKNKQGNQNAWITFKPYNNENVIVDGRNISSSSGHAIFKTESSSYIHITGFKMYNSASRGFYIKGDWVIMDYNNIFNCSSDAMNTHSSNISFQHNTVDWINNNWSGNGFGEEGISLAGSRNFDISNNTISRSGKICIDVKVGCQYGAVHHNIINTSTWPGDQFVNLSAHTGVYSDAWTGRNCYIDIYNNYIYGNHGRGINCGAERNGSADHIRIFNNIIDVSWQWGLGVCPWSDKVSMSNISIFGNTVITDNSGAFSYPLWIRTNNITGNGLNGLTIYNNIFTTRLSHTVVMVEYYLPADNKVILRNNLMYSYNGSYKIRWSSVSSWNETPNRLWGENTILVDPLLKSDYSLNSNSPAIDNGAATPISYDFKGNPRTIPYDIGACAYYSVPPPENPPPNEPPENPPAEEDTPPNAPIKPIGPTLVEAGTVYQYNSSAVDPDGDSVRLRFDWGDGSISPWSDFVTSGTSVSASHTWTTVSNYPIRVIAQDTNGSNSSWSETLTVMISQTQNEGYPPVGTFNLPGNASVKHSMVFDASSSFDPDGTIQSYVWDFGDGITGVGAIVVHTYESPGEYTVTLTVTDNAGMDYSNSQGLRITDDSKTSPEFVAGFLRPNDIIILLVAIAVTGLVLLFVYRYRTREVTLQKHIDSSKQRLALMDQGTADIDQIIDALFAKMKHRKQTPRTDILLDLYNDLIVGRVERNPVIAIPTLSINEVENLVDSRIHAMIVEKLDKM